jgi:protein-L-isoaspartate(D-aspartate) O-methyltransferase
MTPTLLEPVHGAADQTRMRHAMVASQLRTTAVSDTRVIAAMASVPREDFLPAGAAAIAYRDTLIPLGGGRFQNTPLATGRLLTEAALLREDRVLLIGATGGYTAAVLAAMGMTVVAVEEHPELLALAGPALGGMDGVTLIEGPLAAGAPDHAPFDVLLIDGAVEQVPMALAEQVRPEGRIAAGLLERGVTRLAIGRRTAGGAGLIAFADSECAVLPGFGTPQGFRF